MDECSMGQAAFASQILGRQQHQSTMHPFISNSSVVLALSIASFVSSLESG